MKKILIIAVSLLVAPVAFCQISNISTSMTIRIGKAGTDEWPIASLDDIGGKAYVLVCWSYLPTASPRSFSIGFEGSKTVDTLYGILVKQFDKEPSLKTSFVLGRTPVVISREKDTKRISIYAKGTFCYLELNDVQKLFDRTAPLSEGTPLARKSKVQPIVKVDSN